MLGTLLVLPQLAPARVPLERVDGWSKKYDSDFRKYSKRYFGPHFDWRWFKSQAIAESGLDPAARSEVGARGLMQIMPSTYEEIRRMNPHFRDVTHPRWNIAAGIFYDRQLYRKWRTPPPGNERLFFTFGSYNAGYWRIYQALKQAPEKTGSWHEITGLVPPQTHHYVKRIQSLMGTETGAGASLKQ